MWIKTKISKIKNQNFYFKKIQNFNLNNIEKYGKHVNHLISKLLFKPSYFQPLSLNLKAPLLFRFRNDFDIK